MNRRPVRLTASQVEALYGERARDRLSSRALWWLFAVLAIGWALAWFVP